jgi:hypothetical protein
VVRDAPAAAAFVAVAASRVRIYIEDHAEERADSRAHTSLRYPPAVPLTFRIPKTSPELSRRQAVYMAKEMALEQGHSDHVLRRSRSRMEEVDGAVMWEYVIEFPDHE